VIKPSILILFCSILSCSPSSDSGGERHSLADTQAIEQEITGTLITDSINEVKDTLSAFQERFICSQINPKMRKISDFKRLTNEDMLETYTNLLKTFDRYSDSSASTLVLIRYASNLLDARYNLLALENGLTDLERLQIASFMSDMRGRLANRPVNTSK